MKLGSFYKDPLYIITQTNHGAAQAFCAFDFGYLGYNDKGVYAPADLTFKRKWSQDYDGGCEYWINGVKDAYVQFVHFTPTDTYNHKKGVKLGTAKGDHIHVALYYNGWKVYLDYADRTAELFFWQKGQKHFKWTNWETYTDRHLIYYSDIMKDIFTFSTPLTIQSTNTIEMNVRKEPNTGSAIVGKLPPKTKFSCSRIVCGEEVGGQPIWFEYGSGWVSGEYMTDVSTPANCNECETKLALAEAKILSLETDLEKANAELASYKPITYYIKA
jgi:hypothetical protein